MGQNNCYEDEIDLIKIVIKLWKKKLFIICFTLIVSILFTFATCFVIKDKYKAKAVFSIDEILMAGSLSNSNNNKSNSNSNNNKSNSNSNFQVVYSLLESKALQDSIIKKYELSSHFYKKNNKKKINREYYIFKKYFSIKKEKSENIVNIFWEDSNPEFCNKMLNIIVKETNFLLKNIIVKDYGNILYISKIKANKFLANINLYEKEYKELKDNINFMEMQLQLIEKGFILKIIDAPYLLENNSSNKKRLIVILSGILFSFFTSVFLIYLHEFYKSIKVQLKEEENRNK